MEKLQRYFDAIEAELSKIEYAAEPDGLYAPVRYELSLGGRRVRRLPRPRVRPRSRLAAVAASCWASLSRRPSFRAAWCNPRCRLANRSPRPSLQASRRRPPPSRLLP